MAISLPSKGFPDGSTWRVLSWVEGNRKGFPLQPEEGTFAAPGWGPAMCSVGGDGGVLEVGHDVGGEQLDGAHDLLVGQAGEAEVAEDVVDSGFLGLLQGVLSPLRECPAAAADRRGPGRPGGHGRAGGWPSARSPWRLCRSCPSAYRWAPRRSRLNAVSGRRSSPARRRPARLLPWWGPRRWTWTWEGPSGRARARALPFSDATD